MNTQRDPALWIALGIPVLMIVLIAAGILLPRFFVKPPQYSFLYSATDNTLGNDQITYTMNEQGVLEVLVAQPDLSSPDGKLLHGPGRVYKLYLYDTTAHTSKQISFDEARKLKLDSSRTSPDGYDVETGNSDGGFPFGGSGTADQYLVKGSYSERLNISKQFGNMYYDFQFLGWVK